MSTEQAQKLVERYRIAYAKWNRLSDNVVADTIEALVHERDEAMHTVRVAEAVALGNGKLIDKLVQERDALLEENTKISDLWSAMKSERDEYQQAADKLAAENKVLRDALSELDNWLVCGCGYTEGDMSGSFQRMQKVTARALKGEVK